MLQLESTMLRAPVESDIADYFRWVYIQTEWMLWDAPWEQWNDDDKRSFIDSVVSRIGATPEIFYRLEIETISGEHIGWVSAYEIDDHKLAVGIDIPEISARKKGHATRALKLFISYLFDKTGHTEIYTQTWSGNTRMLRLAEKIGFTLLERVENHRIVNSQSFDSLTFVYDKDNLITAWA